MNRAKYRQLRRRFVRCHLRPFSVQPTSEFVADSALEGDGFELPVPRQESPGFPTHSGWYARIRTGFPGGHQARLRRVATGVPCFPFPTCGMKRAGCAPIGAPCSPSLEPRRGAWPETVGEGRQHLNPACPPPGADRTERARGPPSYENSSRLASLRVIARSRSTTFRASTSRPIMA